MKRSTVSFCYVAVTAKLDLNVRKNLVMRYIWSTVFYGVETLTLPKVDHKYLKRLPKCSFGEI